MTKITLDPNEDNELGFNLSIEGKTSDSDATNPKIRFVVKEQGSNQAFMFDNIKHENGMAKVVLPSDQNMFSENKDYNGALEVILGKHYFVATTVDLNFVEPLKVEASVVTNGKQKLSEASSDTEEDDLKIESAIDSVIIKNKEKQPTPKKEHPKAANDEKKVMKESKQEEKKRILSYRDLSEEQKQKVNKLFLSKCKKLGVKNPTRYMKEGTAYTKKRLKALMAESIKVFS